MVRVREFFFFAYESSFKHFDITQNMHTKTNKKAMMSQGNRAMFIAEWQRKHAGFKTKHNAQSISQQNTIEHSKRTNNLPYL